MKQLAGRVAVVTGAASGIGRAMAARFVAEGMRCILADVEEAALESAKVWGDALDPDEVAGVVVDAVRAQRFYILTHPEESFDMVEQQLRWMKTNVPLEPGPGVARQTDADARR